MQSQNASVWQEYLPNLKQVMIFSEKIFQSLLVLLVGQIIICLLKYISRKKLLIMKSRNERAGKTMSTIIGSFLQYVIYFIIICQILTIFGVSVSSILAVAGIGSVAIGFGAQSLVKDILTGIFILADDEFAVSDSITVGQFSGTVEAIGLRTTQIRSATGELHIIPNGDITAVTNLSKGALRAMVNVAVSHKAKIDHVIAILEDEMSGFQNDAITAPPVVQGVVALDEGSATIRIVCDCKWEERWGVELDIRRAVKRRLEREDIPLPRPVMQTLPE